MPEHGVCLQQVVGKSNKYLASPADGICSVLCQGLDSLTCCVRLWENSVLRPIFKDPEGFTTCIGVVKDSTSWIILSHSFAFAFAVEQLPERSDMINHLCCYPGFPGCTRSLQCGSQNTLRTKLTFCRSNFEGCTEAAVTRELAQNKSLSCLYRVFSGCHLASISTLS